jgi:tRNA(fMet)-specific endonuclease VapC
MHRRPPGREQVVHYDALGELLVFRSGWTILPFDRAAAERFHELKAQRIRIGTMDLKIAAIVLTRGGTLRSANLRDFRRVPNLLVEDWLAGE